jgi:hypothetical protein
MSVDESPRSRRSIRHRPVAGETGTQMYQALGEDGRMLVYGSLTGTTNHRRGAAFFATLGRS